MLNVIVSKWTLMYSCEHKLGYHHTSKKLKFRVAQHSIKLVEQAQLG